MRIRIAPFLALCLLLSGCGELLEEAAEQALDQGGIDVDLDDVEDGDFTINFEGEDGEQATININGEEGTVDIETEDGEEGSISIDSEDGTVEIEADGELRIEHVAEDGTVTVLKQVPVVEGEIVENPEWFGRLRFVGLPPIGEDSFETIGPGTQAERKVAGRSTCVGIADDVVADLTDRRGELRPLLRNRRVRNLMIDSGAEIDREQRQPRR